MSIAKGREFTCGGAARPRWPRTLATLYSPRTHCRERNDRFPPGISRTSLWHAKCFVSVNSSPRRGARLLTFSMRDCSATARVSAAWAGSMRKRCLRRGIEYDQLFGPAYKGITLAAATAIGLAATGHNVPFSFNRKEAKDHGEGGTIVGAPLQGRVVIVDDVITAGTSVRESVAIIEAAGAAPAGVLIALDRMERGHGDTSAVQDIRDTFGIPVVPIATLDDVMTFIEASTDLARARAGNHRVPRAVRHARSPGRPAMQSFEEVMKPFAVVPVAQRARRRSRRDRRCAPDDGAADDAARERVPVRTHVQCARRTLQMDRRARRRSLQRPDARRRRQPREPRVESTGLDGAEDRAGASGRAAPRPEERNRGAGRSPGRA